MSARPERPSLLVTVDTEGDDLWSGPRTITTENARLLPRFQDLCERHRVRPTYLVAFEMAISVTFRTFAVERLRHDAIEIGMHLHPWNSPPEVPLTPHDHRLQPRLTDYPEPVMHDKIVRLTRLLEDAFERPVLSHRGGRWGFDATYARLLAGCGYRVDSSVTPHVSWRRRGRGPFEASGPDYTEFPEQPYFVDPDDVSRAGASPLLEVPLTTYRIPFDDPRVGRGPSAPHVVRWLRPNGRNGPALRGVARRALAEPRECLVLMLHSSELMPGASPAVRDRETLESLYADLEALFRELGGAVTSRTLTEFHAAHVRRRDGASAVPA